jgi:protein TonB
MRSGAPQNRRFAYAVAISVVAHALVLYGGRPLLRESFEEPVSLPPLVTRLVELPKPAPEPVLPPAPEQKREKPLAPKKEARKPEAPKPLPQPSPIAEPKPEPAPAEAPAVAPVPPVATAPAAPQPQVDTRAAEAVSAAQYRLQLIEAARRNKPPYPALARENNWTGEVALEIVLRPDGRAELHLRRGSGHAVLDKLALDTYQQALRVVPVPPALHGRQIRLDPLRVIYDLKD